MTEAQIKERLATYLNNCNDDEEFELMKVLKIAESENASGSISIFLDHPSDVWCKKILTHTLLCRYRTRSSDERSQLLREIDELDIFMKENIESYSIEDVLVRMLENPEKSNLDIDIIKRALSLMRSEESLSIIFKDAGFSSEVLPELDFLQFKQKCDECEIIYSDERQVKEFKDLLPYSDKIVNSILSQIIHKTSIVEVINFFKVLKNREDFFNEFVNDFPENLTKLNLLSSIERSIEESFPTWNFELARSLPDNLIDFNRKYFSSKDFTYDLQYTKYSQVSNPRQALLNKSLDSKNHNLFLHKLLYSLNKILIKSISRLDCPDKVLLKIRMFIKSLDSETKIIELINTLEILMEWSIKILEPRVIEIISNSTELDVQKNIHDFVIENSFSKTYEKSLDELMEELLACNGGEDIELLKNRDDLQQEYHKVMNAYNGTSAILDNAGSMNKWNTNVIEEWSNKLYVSRLVKAMYYGNLLSELKLAITGILVAIFPSSTSTSYDLAKSVEFSNKITMSISKYERIAVIMRVLEVTMKIKLRDVQILSVILLLNSHENKGRLAQIDTGEGKTIIIAILAAYYALDGRKVDVITSSEVLAIPQSREFEKFYHTLKLTVSHNFDSPGAYYLDIVYSTCNRFQGDILRDEFRKANTRRGRRCEIAIVDEVDNMLVDGNDHMVYLSCDMPGMDHLETLLAIISIQLKIAAGALVKENGQTYFVDRQNAIDNNGEITDEIIENYIKISDTPYDFVSESTDLHMRKLIRSCDRSTVEENYPEIKVPKHLRHIICQVQLKKWIQRGIEAKIGYANKEDYILIDEEVTILDAENTGVIQKNTHYCDGLHQFIQIKHGASLSPESFTTNFISNVTYFRRYRANIYGLTGTLGTKGTKQLLKNTYSVDCVIIPPFKLKQHHQLASIIIDNEDDWLREIVKSSFLKLNNGRAVLIITEYIKKIEAIEKIFIDEFKYDKNKIKIYKTNDDSSVADELLKAGDVLITTNIAGRGTDIKLHKDIDENGGLHVCLTFLPKNSRVEEQNIGRTSRTGNGGTSQFILNNSEKDIELLRKQRSTKEEEAMKNAEKEIEEVIKRDAIFHEFCQLIAIIKGRNEFVRDIERQAVEERFGLWLKLNNDEITSGTRSEALRLFQLFSEEIVEDDGNNSLVKNPCMYVQTGNEYLEKKKYIDAINEYTLAISLDENFSEHAHYNRGYAYIAQYGNNLVEHSNYITAAVYDFKRARQLIEEREHYLHLMQNASAGPVYSKQISNKLNLYNIQKHAIQIAIGPDQEVLARNINELEEKLASNKLTPYEEERISETIENFANQRDNIGVIQEAINNEGELTIKVIKLKKCLPDGDESHDNEIREFERNGAIGGFHMSELPPIDWVSVIGLLLLGFGQVITGAALTIFTMGGGATFGIGLIAEGISDIITAVKDGIINRDFSWQRWAIEKAISLTVSVVCAGWSAMKDLAMTVKGGAKIIGSIGTRGIPPLVKEGWKLVTKKVGLELAKGFSKEILECLTNYGISETLIPIIQQKIIEKVQGPITESLESNSSVKMMLELDRKNNNNEYENRLRNMGLELLNPANPSNELFNYAEIAKKIHTGISEKKNPHLKKIRQVSSAINSIEELSIMTERFLKELNKEIEKMAQNDKIKERYANQMKSVDRNAEHSSGANFKINKQDFNINRLNEEDEQVEARYDYDGPTRLSKNYTSVISIKMIDIIQRDFVAPVVKLGAEYTVDKAWKNKSEALDGYIETLKSRRRVHQRLGEAFEEAEE